LHIVPFACNGVFSVASLLHSVAKTCLFGANILLAEERKLSKKANNNWIKKKKPSYC
jgi:hypothetical protein